MQKIADVKGDAEIAGLYSENNGINLVRLTDAVREGTVPHEVGHFIFNAIFSAKERRKLLEYYKSKIKDVAGLTEDEINRRAEEMFCDDFAEYFLNDESKPKTKLQRMFERMKRFLRKLVDMFSFKNHPYTESELDLRRDDANVDEESLAALFGRMANGDIYNRGLSPTSNGNVYAAAMQHMYTPEARRQMDVVRRKYEGTDSWMKAPNGRPTNLTEEQWLLVRTPNFKEWFGDWEKMAEVLKFENSTPIPVRENIIRGNNRMTARKAAELWANENLPVKVQTLFGEIEINNASVKDSLGHGYGQKKLDAITSLPEGMKIASFIGESADFNGNPIDNGFFCYPITYGETLEKDIVFCRVRRDVNANKLYIHEVWLENEIKDISLQTSAEFLNSKPRGGNALYKNILARFLNFDKREVSKVIDENGEPLVVHHGSNKKFKVFDRTKGRANMDIQGMFFSPWELDASGYGENIYSVFLNIRNPANSSTAFKALKSHVNENGAGVKAREDLIKQGFDGVNNDNEEYIAFDSNQIKSVDNNGNFDPSNENIHAQFVSARQASNFEVTRDIVTRAEEMYNGGATDQDVWKETGCIRYAEEP